MTKPSGDYFKDKAEAVEYYRNNDDSLKDKPDWLIECVIDFACQFPNYKEYCEVEHKVKEGKPLTVKQKKKYGHLKWEKEYTEYKKVRSCMKMLKSTKRANMTTLSMTPKHGQK